MGSDSEILDDEEEKWEELTIMQGPDVSGKERIRFGESDTWEKMDDTGDVYVAAEPIETVPLPCSMTREEIELWLTEDKWGERLLNRFDSVESDPRIK